MDLVKSWTVGLGVWLVGSLLTTALVTDIAKLTTFRSLSGRVLVDYLPSLVVLAAVAGVAALVHPQPARMDPSRHSTAALGIPTVSVAASIALIAFNGPAVKGTIVEAIIITVAASALGSVAGWRLADMLRPPHPSRIPASGRFYRDSP